MKVSSVLVAATNSKDVIPMELVDGGSDIRIAVGCSQAVGLEQILAVDNHLGPAVDRNRDVFAIHVC